LKGRIKPVPGRGRDDAIYDFLLSASQYPNPELAHVLLLDSEVSDDGRLFERLTQEGSWRPRTVVPSERQVGWMVQVMEAWFLADRDALYSYYGSNLNANALPKNPKVEAISKSDIWKGLKRATRKTGKGDYHKGSHAPRLLEKLDPDRVRAAAPHCARMLKILDGAVAG